MEKVEWKVEGMDCTNCALTITRYLQKEGQKEREPASVSAQARTEPQAGHPGHKRAGSAGVGPVARTRLERIVPLRREGTRRRQTMGGGRSRTSSRTWCSSRRGVFPGLMSAKAFP